MIYTKEGLTKGRFIELLKYSMKPECQFLTADFGSDVVEISNFSAVYPGTVVKLLKVEEKKFSKIDTQGNKSEYVGYSVKVLIEDKYWKKENGKTAFYKTQQVPDRIFTDVAEILNC